MPLLSWSGKEAYFEGSCIWSQVRDFFAHEHWAVTPLITSAFLLCVLGAESVSAGFTYLQQQ